MLSSLHIENIAVIEKTDISFNNGFNVLTGETGAGKSIVIDAINAILGERTSHDLIRTGSDSASVTAVFDDVSDDVLLQMSELGYDCDDRSLMIFRKIFSDGRNTVKINGMPANVSVLKRLGAYLINIHGQHDSQHLLDAARHIDYIDLVVGCDDILAQYQDAYSQYCDAKKHLDQLKSASENATQRADYLRYVVNELESADIEVGEREDLIKQRDLMRNSADIAQQLTQVYNMLNGDDYNQGVPSTINNAANELSLVSKYDEDFRSVQDKLAGFGYEIEEIIATIDNYLSKIDFSTGLLDSIEARLDYLFRLSKKYGSTEEEMLEFLENSKDELDSLDTSAEHIEKLELEVEDKLQHTISLAERLSEMRRKGSVDFATKVCKELTYLDMPNAQFEVSVNKTELNSNGCDEIEFLITANAGETLKSLSKVASGGELSRIMLAIKTVIADKDDVDTLIFDEIDSGISGSAARKVGIKIKEIAKNKQIVCVTHLAQIASLADVHFKIEKSVDGERTFTQVDLLDESGRVEEVARIMSTGVITDSMRQSARELMN